jgi:hypothetical protein
VGILIESLLLHGTVKLYALDQEIKLFFKEIPGAKELSSQNLLIISKKSVGLNGRLTGNNSVLEVMTTNYTFGI